MITVSTPASVSRADDVSMRYSDSGVVINRSGGRRMSFWRSLAEVSPVRMATSGATNPSPRRSAASSMPLSGAGVLLDVEGQRPQRGDVQHAGPVRPPLGPRRGGEPIDRGKKAVSVLPEPVGAQISVCSPADDAWPPLDLRRRRLGERRREPLPNGRRERLEHRVWAMSQLYRGGVTVNPRPARPGQPPAPYPGWSVEPSSGRTSASTVTSSPASAAVVEHECHFHRCLHVAFARRRRASRGRRPAPRTNDVPASMLTPLSCLVHRHRPIGGDRGPRGPTRPRSAGSSHRRASPRDRFR